VASEKPYEIVPGVYHMGTDTVNWYLVEDEGRLTAVDAGLPGFAKTLDSDLEALGFKLEDVAAVVLTHSDADHTGVAPRLQEAGAEVWIHADDEETLRHPRPKSPDASPLQILRQLANPRLWKLLPGMLKDGGAKPSKVEGARTFSGAEVLDIPGRPRVVPTPGHTPGHCALHFEGRGALFVGDEMCTRNLLDGSSGPQLMPSLMNVSTDQCFRSLAAIEAVDAEVLLPGHGEQFHGSPAAAVAQARKTARS